MDATLKHIPKTIEAPDVDMSVLVAEARAGRPEDLATEDVKLSRHWFLRESLGIAKGDDTFERVLKGNELQPVNFLERGVVAARAIARVTLRSAAGRELGSGTGFLIAPQVLITNNHVLPTQAVASAALAQFGYELDLRDAATGPITFRTEPHKLFYTSVELDFTVVAIAPASETQTTALSDFGCLPLLDFVGKAAAGEWLTIIQHPNGERKQLCVRENQLLKHGADVLWYSTDTMPGSSGAPVFNNDWYVVALHHKGVAEQKNGITQTVDGQDYDPRTMDESRVKWIANEGVRASRITQTLKVALPGHALLKPLYDATPASARISEYPRLVPSAGTRPSQHNVPAPAREVTPVSEASARTFPIEVRLQIHADGRVTQLDSTPATAAESMIRFEMEAARRKRESARIDAPFDFDYSKRKGYVANFLGPGALSVPLPQLDSALQAVAAPLISPKNGNKFVLHYNNFSVVMHKKRRLPIYSAANVSFGGRFEMNRPPDVWRRDPRILAEYQLENWYYASNNFDRGHMTRREDLEYGDTPVLALQSAADTCHWSNCVPQHSKFNQNRETWQGIERYVLESSIINGNVNAQIMTGPMLSDGDPEYRNIPYPVQFWKVVAALDSAGALFATAYIASQEDAIAEHGIEVTEPFGAFKTYQTKIAEIERLTGLTFVCAANGSVSLKTKDPLERTPRRRVRRRSAGALESRTVPLPPDYYEIADLDDIQLE